MCPLQAVARERSLLFLQLLKSLAFLLSMREQMEDYMAAQVKSIRKHSGTFTVTGQTGIPKSHFILSAPHT